MPENNFQKFTKDLLGVVKTDPSPYLYAPPDAPGGDPRTGVPPVGVGLRFTPRLGKPEYFPDWLELKLETLDDKQRYFSMDPVVAVHWPTFLRRAYTHYDAYAMAARKFLRLIQPDLMTVDAVLAGYLLLPEDVERFNAITLHLDTALNLSFFHKLWSVLRRRYEPFTSASTEATFKRCDACLAYKVSARKLGTELVESADTVSRCTDCFRRRRFSLETTLFDIDSFKNAEALTAFIPAFTHSTVRPGARYASDVPYLLAGLVDYDGAFPYKRDILVHWPTYVRRIADCLRKTPPEKWEEVLSRRTRLTTRTVPRDIIAALVDDSEEAIQFVARSLQGEIEYYTEKYALGSVSRVDESYVPRNGEARYSAAGLRRLFESSVSKTVLNNVRNLRRAQKKPRDERKPYTRQALELQGPDGLYTMFRRRGSSWHIQLPLRVLDGIKPPYNIQKQYVRAGTDDIDAEWTLRDLEKLYDRYVYAGVSIAEDVRTMLNWCRVMTRHYDTTPNLYKNALREQRLERRADLIRAGDRSRMGRFSSDEVLKLQEFIAGRTLNNPGKAFMGPLSDLEWQKLEYILPFRSKLSINRKIEELGFEYAKKTSWVEYLASGYGTRKSGKRRTYWVSKGVKVSR